MSTLVVRFRGLGDVLLSWFGLESLRETDDVSYLTSPNAAELFPPGWVSVIPYDWREHPLTVNPDLPNIVRDIPHDRLINLVNNVDWMESVSDYSSVGRARQFGRLMGVDVSSYVRPITVSFDEVAWATSVLEGVRRPIVLCQTDARSPTRRWCYWSELSVLLSSMGCGVVWCGDTPQSSPPHIHNFTGATTVRQWLALLWSANLIVSACTSAVHVGARVPHVWVVGLYGSTDYRLFTEFYTNVRPVTSYSLPCAPCADWQSSSKCYKRAGAPWCLNLISPYRVIHEIKKLL